MELEQTDDTKLPPYAILPHKREDEEVSFDEMASNPPGVRIKEALRRYPHLVNELEREVSVLAGLTQATTVLGI